MLGPWVVVRSPPTPRSRADPRPPPNLPKPAPKGANFSGFLGPCGAKPWGGGGAPPTTLILLRNQRTPPAPSRAHAGEVAGTASAASQRPNLPKSAKNAIFFSQQLLKVGARGGGEGGVGNSLRECGPLPDSRCRSVWQCPWLRS